VHMLVLRRRSRVIIYRSIITMAFFLDYYEFFSSEETLQSETILNKFLYVIYYSKAFLV
jgi:hypothetical protein